MGAFDNLTAAQRHQIREAHAQRKLTAADIASRTDRGTCKVCEREMAITKAGRIRRHGAKDGSWPPRPCPGGDMKPKEG